MMKMSIKSLLYRYAGIACISLTFLACKNLAIVNKTENKNLPTSYGSSTDTVNTAKTKWKDFFKDPQLCALIDSALKKTRN